MNKNQDNILAVELLEVLISGAELPAEILSLPFRKYLFFDADIGSSFTLINTLQTLMKVCFPLNAEAYVFSASNHNYLGSLQEAGSWSSQVGVFNQTLRNQGDHYGLILIDTAKKWVMYQKCPIDVGLFAFDCNRDLQNLRPLIEECFFSCEDIVSWLKEKTGPGTRLGNSVDRGYFVKLLENYS